MEPTKLYFSISEVADLLGVSKSLIRFWEAEFDLKPNKNSKGERRFTQKNIAQLRTIYHLVKERGFTLEGAKQEMSRDKERLAVKFKTIESLTKLRVFLETLKDNLD